MTTTKNEVKRTPAIDVKISDTNTDMVLTFSNGKTLELEVSQFKSNIIDYAVMHGLKQKLVDAAAISRDIETGLPATIDSKYNAVKEVLDRLLSGNWNAIREGGNSNGGLLFKALCRIYSKKSPEQITEYLAGKTEAEKTALRKNAKIAGIIDQLRIESGKASGIDSDSLLNELE